MVIVSIFSKNNIKKAVNIIKTGRIGRLFELILNTVSFSILRPIFVYDRFYILVWGDVPQKISKRSTMFKFRVADITDIPKLNELDYQGNSYEDKLKIGDIGIIAEFDEKIAGMKWIRLKPDYLIPEDDYLIKFPENSASCLGLVST